VLALCVSHSRVSSQTSPPQKKTVSSQAQSSLCNRENAIQLIEQQIDSARLLSNNPDRVRVLINAADLLWTIRNKVARKTFADAFEFGTQDFKEHGDNQIKLGVGLVMDRADLRFNVITAIAKRDPLWASKLREELLKEQTEVAKDAVQKDPRREEKTAQQLLTVALSLLPDDQQTAASFARASLKYPATLSLPQFLYRFAALNKAGADQLYQEALAAYGGGPMERFLFLSAYPFGNARDAGETVGYTIYQVPEGFVPNVTLQRIFLQNLLMRAQQMMANPAQVNTQFRIAEPGQVWMALTLLENKIARALPEFAAQSEETRKAMLAMIPQNSQDSVTELVSWRTRPRRSFWEQVEAAQKEANVNVRDRGLTFAVMSSNEVENLDQVIAVVDKISDSNLRQPLTDWLLFERTQTAIKKGNLNLARSLAGRVSELDQRAYLYSQIAQKALREELDQTESREMLEEVVAAASKATPSITSVRTLLGSAYLYTKLDMNRAVAILGEAVRQINQMEQPDFSRQFVVRKIEGKEFSAYANFSTSGFTPEDAFQSIGAKDFDGMLAQTNFIQDKALRAKTTLALIEPCLLQPVRPKRSTK
jgi:hypothetical protein